LKNYIKLHLFKSFSIMSSSEVSSKSLLFSPLKIRGVTLKNRICVAPMCTYSCEDGFVNDWHLVHLGSFAIGGAALVMVEATGVEARGRLSPGCPGLWKDEQIEPMARIVKFLKSQDSVPAIQLAHGGRKASTLRPWVGRDSIADEDGGWPTIGPSAVAYGDHVWKVPKAATLKDIDDIKNSFVSAAKRAVKAGFEVNIKVLINE
jgi:2,4-dienoyl-CoA reductase-like NADH-dependent reductase (Old Yellow Enzyme family)